MKKLMAYFPRNLAEGALFQAARGQKLLDEI